MARSQGTCLTFIVLMIIGTVNAGRWLELEPYSTASLISDGIDREKRCESIYGFLPCADTMPEGVFLMIIYTYLMMSAEKWIGEGSNALFLLLGDQAFGASVFQVLMALPKIVLVIGNVNLSILVSLFSSCLHTYIIHLIKCAYPYHY